MLKEPGITGMVSRMAQDNTADREPRKSPLVVQAEILARFLNPPASPRPPVTSPRPVPLAVAPVVRPAMASLPFRLHATCYNSSRPEESRALIGEPGDGRTRRWLKEGMQIGHFIVQEIRDGAVICVNGDQVQELVVESGPLRVSLVKDHGGTVAQVGSLQETEDATIDVNTVSEGLP
jgi:hypothetical protein